MSRLLDGLLGGLYREGEPGAEGGGAGGGAPAGDAGGAGGAPAGGAPAGGPPADKGGAGDGGTGTGDAASLAAEAKRIAEGTPAPTVIPEKLIVRTADGKGIDHEKTALKIAEGYKALETRMGSAGGAAPEKADDYKLTLGEGEKELPKLDDAMAAKFRERAKAMGLNQAQYNNMVRTGNEFIADVVKGLNLPTYADTRVKLIAHYGSESAYKEAAGRAYQGFAAFADETDLAELDAIGNIPVFVRIFDRIARELPEDKLPTFNSSAAAGEKAEVEKLQGDTKSAYWNPKEPGHAAAVEKVRAFHERQARQTAFSK